MALIDLRPRQVDIEQRPGTDITVTCTVGDWNIASATITANITNRDGTAAVVSSWTIGQVGQVITLSLDEVDTALLGQGQFNYAVVITVAGNTISPFAGSLILSNNPSRSVSTVAQVVTTDATATITIDPVLNGDATLIDGGTATGGDELIDGGSA